MKDKLITATIRIYLTKIKPKHFRLGYRIRFTNNAEKEIKNQLTESIDNWITDKKYFIKGVHWSQAIKQSAPNYEKIKLSSFPVLQRLQNNIDEHLRLKKDINQSGVFGTDTTDVIAFIYDLNNRMEGNESAISDSTLKHYFTLANLLREFCDYKNNKTLTWSSFDVKFVHGFQAWCKDVRGNHPATIRKKLQRFRKIERIYSTYYNKSRERLFNNIKINLDGHGTPKKLDYEKSLSYTMMQEFEELNLEKPKFEKYKQTYFLFEMWLFMAYTGIRVSDLISLKFSDIKRVDINKEKFYAIKRKPIKKEGKYYEVILSKKALAIIQKYQTEKKKENYVFPLMKIYGEIYIKPSQVQRDLFDKISKTMTSNINNAMERMVAMTEIDFSVSCHTARHTFATRLIEDKKIRIVTLQKILGHAKISTTMKYYHASFQNIHEEFIELMD